MRVIVAGARRPLVGQTVCGDAFAAIDHARGTLVCLAHLAPQALADAILSSHGKARDDARCVVARLAGEGA